jgi:hypothetical protein
MICSSPDMMIPPHAYPMVYLLGEKFVTSRTIRLMHSVHKLVLHCGNDKSHHYQCDLHQQKQR